MKGVIVPKNKHDLPPEQPLIFLAGPISGAPNWQDRAIDIISSYDLDLVIVSPRWEINEKIRHLLLGNPDPQPFQRAREFERYYLEKAQKQGVMMFWLPGEIEHRCEKSYGAMTRFELGHCLASYRHNPQTRFCLGTDGQFPEFHTVAYDLERDAPGKIISRTLEETCLEGIRIVFNSD